VCRRARAMLVWPARRRMLMIRLPVGGHDVRPGAGAYLGEVLAEGDVAELLQGRSLAS
jgi:hypothetical protein